MEPGFCLSKEGLTWELYTQKRIKVWSHYMTECIRGELDGRRPLRRGCTGGMANGERR